MTSTTPRRLKLSLVLFDEIEKASDALWQLLLGILDKATLTLGDNRRVDFSHTMVFLDVQPRLAEHDAAPDRRHRILQRAEAQRAKSWTARFTKTATEAARKKFSPEFMNRIDKVIVFRMLQREHLEKILDIELGRVQDRIISSSNQRQSVRLQMHRARPAISCSAKARTPNSARAI